MELEEATCPGEPARQGPRKWPRPGFRREETEAPPLARWRDSAGMKPLARFLSRLVHDLRRLKSGELAKEHGFTVNVDIREIADSQYHGPACFLPRP